MNRAKTNNCRLFAPREKA